MGTRLINTLKGAALGGVLCLFAGVYHVIDRHGNYVETEAIIDSDTRYCGFDGYKDVAADDASQKMDCAAAERLKENHPKFRGTTIVYLNEVALSYVSPADRATHRGNLVLTRYGSPDESVFQGARIKILAHKSEPSTISAK